MAQHARAASQLLFSSVDWSQLTDDDLHLVRSSVSHCGLCRHHLSTHTALLCPQLLSKRGLARAAERNTCVNTLIESIARDLPLHLVQHCLRQCDGFAMRRSTLLNCNGVLIGYSGARLQVAEQLNRNPVPSVQRHERKTYATPSSC
jgi:hypothetical protein